MKRKTRNHTKHADPRDFDYYTSGLPPDSLATIMHVTEATARAWLSGEQRAPWWTIPVFELSAMRLDDQMRRSGRQRLGVVKPGARVCTVYSLTRDGRQVRAVQAQRDADARNAVTLRQAIDDAGLLRA